MSHDMNYRFTPACAGRIGHQTLAAKFARVHPRMCGADVYTMDGYLLKEGSPPHVRGGSLRVFLNRFVIRFTPACAGRMKVLK